MQQPGPKYGTSHVGHLAPPHARRQTRANDAAYTSAGNDRSFDAGFIQRFDYADVRQSAHRAATECQPNAF